jgi:hypothetical protein
MILPQYLARKFFKSFIICALLSYSVFFIFSLLGNLGEKLSFKSIFFLSTLNSFQIFTYIPSHLFILSLLLFVLNLKSENELIIIKEYFDLKKSFLIIFPILALFIYAEIKKEKISNTIEKLKLNIVNSKKVGDTKIFISLDGNTKKYTIFSGNDQNNTVINQYLSFESQNQKIERGEISTNIYFKESDLFSNESTVYEKNNFRYVNANKRLFENFQSFWTENTGKITKRNMNNRSSGYSIIHSIFFSGLFYFCITMIFFSKKLVDRGINILKIFLLVLSIFLYYLLIPRLMLNNFQNLFNYISIMTLILIFFNIKKYE